MYTGVLLLLLTASMGKTNSSLCFSGCSSRWGRNPEGRALTVSISTLWGGKLWFPSSFESLLLQVLTRPDRSQSHRCTWFTHSLPCPCCTVKHLPLPMCICGGREMLMLHPATFQKWESELFRKVESQWGRTSFNLKTRCRSNLKF